MIVLLPFTVVGCKEKEVEVSFDNLSTMLLEFDTAVRPFFSTIELAYAGTEDSDLLTASTNSIKTLSYEMGESFKSFNAVLAELESNQSSDVTLTQVEDSITIKTSSMEFISKLSRDGNCMSIISKNSTQEYVYEITKKESGGYYAQIVIKNEGADNYSIYQINFIGTTGSFNLDMAATGYISIYKAEVSDSNFPNVSSKIFKNN